MSGESSDISVAWEEACMQFQKATGFDLKSATTRENREDVVAKFNSIKTKDEEDRQKVERVKNVVGRTIVAVERLGQIAADGASMVFGSPANITMNCISFFINVGVEYKNISRNIEDLFGRIVPIMERFQMYRDNEQVLKLPMIRVAHRLLISIIDICRLCHKIMTKSWAKKVLKVALFSDDGGIKDQLALLDSLESQELQMKTTSSLIASEKTQQTIQNVDAQNAKIASYVSELTENATDQKILKELKENLGADDSLSKGEYQWYNDKFDMGSCSWLKSDEEYISWSNSEDKTAPLLLLKGDEGCGKSYVMTAIIRDLLQRYPQNQDDATRISISYCYLTRGGKKNTQTSRNDQNAQGERSIRDALREWAWQIINKDIFYRKNIQALFKKSSDLGDLKEIWQKLFLSHLNENVTFYLLLDGTHELDERGVSDLCTVIQTLSTESGPGRLKIAITSRPTLVQKLSIPSAASSPVVDLRAKNRADMEKYIRSKADTLTIFQKTTSQVQALKEEVCTKLLDAVDGNFSLADLKLREISTKYDPEEVRQIVYNVNSSADLKDSVADIIRECNRTLTTREMEDLNTILLWIMHAKWVMQVYELEAVLFVQQGRASLQPLVLEIKEKFSSFFELDGDDNQASVTLKYDSIAEYFRNVVTDSQATETSSSSTLTKGEIRMVQHFVEKLCDQDIYNRLGLGEFFDQKLSQSETGVMVDCENAHARIVLTCVRAISEDLGDECQPLKQYSVFHLASHLKQIDLDRIDPRLKAELGPPLVKLFRDPEAIHRAYDSGCQWSYMDEALQSVVRLFHSSALKSKIDTAGTEDKAWVEAILNDSNPEIALLKESARSIAEKWLSAEDSHVAMRCFSWLYGYMNKIQNYEDPKERRFEWAREYSKIELQDIENVVQKIELIYSPDMSNLRALRNLATTYRDCGHIFEAIKQFEHIIDLDSEYNLALAGLALTYAAEVAGGPRPDWEKALHYQEILIKRLEAGTRLFTSNEPKDDLEGLLWDKASWLRKLKQFDEPLQIYLKWLNDEPDNFEVLLEYIFTLCEAERYTTVVEAFQDMDQVHDEAKNNRLVQLFQQNADNEAYHSSVVQAYHHCGDISRVKAYYEQSLADARQNTSDYISTHVRTILTYRLAAMIWNHAREDADKEEAIKLWESILADSNTYAQVLAARRLARIYITKAVEAGSDSVRAHEMLERVKSFVRRDGTKAEDEDGWGMGLSTAQVRSLLARYHSRVGDVQMAQKLLKPDMDVGLKLLCDEDPDNDWQGYRKLGDVFMDCGDDDNAIAAWSLIQPTQGLHSYRNNIITSPRMNGDSGTTLETSDARPLLRHETTSFNLANKLDGPLTYSCDGRCGREWTYADDIYICRECIDCQFDASCLEKLQQGTLARDICDKNHSFLHIPAWDIASADRVDAGTVLVGNRVLDVNEWREGVKQDWDATLADEKAPATVNSVITGP